MDDAPGYEAYPISLVILCNLVPLGIYGLGGYILAGWGAGALVAYGLYCLWVEAQVLRKSCVDCYYYGRRCGLGKGRLCALLFAQGSPRRFAERQASWKDVLPELMVFVAPLVGGIARLVTHFAWPVLLALAALVALNFAGNAAVRGAIMCRHCRQRAIGCPAQKLFAGKSAQ